MANLTNHSGIKLAVLTAAAGVAFGGTAHATLVSEAPAGFTPVTVGGGQTQSYSFSIDGSGTTEFTLSSTASGMSLIPANATDEATSFLANLESTTNPSSLAIGGVKQESAYTIGSNSFTYGTPEYVALASNATSAGIETFATAGTLGYLEGELIAGAGTSLDTFQLLDFGLVEPTSVPEPASLALLAAGAAGIAALRRRRLAEAA